MKKKVLITLIVAALLAAVVFRIFSPSKTSGQRPAFGGGGKSRGPTAVKIEDVTTGDIMLQREFTGSINAAYTYTIAAKVAGNLHKISKRIGDAVSSNEVIGQIDDTEYRLAVDEAAAQVKISQASIDEAKAQLQYLDREFKRSSELVSKGVISQAELDAIETQRTAQQAKLSFAEAQLAQRNAALTQARTKSGYTTLRSTKQGFVSERFPDEGALLSVNSPVLTIVGLDTVFIDVPVTERDYPYIKRGLSCKISVDAFPDTFFAGEVTGTSAAFSNSSRAATTEIAVANPFKKLKPGMFARITMTLAEKKSVQLVPLTALTVRNEKNCVFTVINDTARQVNVIAGIIDQHNVEIISPRLSGKVVTLGQHLLSNNAAVITGSRGNNETAKKGPVSSDKGAAR